MSVVYVQVSMIFKIHAFLEESVFVCILQSFLCGSFPVTD